MVRRSGAASGAVFAFLFAAVSAPAAESGQPPTQASDSVAAQPLELARVRYRRGVEAFEEGRYREAIDLFLDADQLSPSAALSFNIATAYERIDEPASALRWYRDYLRRQPEATDAAQVQAVVAKYEAVLKERGVQQVTVSSTPPGAALSIDGHALGATPWTFETTPGAHRLQFTLAGHEALTKPIELSPDHAMDVSVELTPAAPVAAPAEPAKAPESSPADQKAYDPTMRTLGWIGLAAGGAALGGALVFEGLRRSAESAAEQEQTQVGYADKLQTMEGHQTTARVLLGVGAALAVTGGVLVWVGRPPSRPGEAGVALSCGPGGCMSTLRGRF